MISAGLLKLLAHLSRQRGLVANDHGRNQRRVLPAPKSVRRVVDVIEYAAANAAAPKAQRGAVFSRKDFNIVRLDRGHGGNAESMEIAFVIESAGIAEISRRAQFGSEFDPVAISQMRKFRSFCIGVFRRLGLFEVV